MRIAGSELATLHCEQVNIFLNVLNELVQAREVHRRQRGTMFEFFVWSLIVPEIVSQFNASQTADEDKDFLPLHMSDIIVKNVSLAEGKSNVYPAVSSLLRLISGLQSDRNAGPTNVTRMRQVAEISLQTLAGESICQPKYMYLLHAYL